MPIVDRIVPIAPFSIVREYSGADRGWGGDRYSPVDWLKQCAHPLSKEARTEVPILGQYIWPCPDLRKMMNR
jgi:hypothetical protein